VKQFLDTTVLVESCLNQSPKFVAADALVNSSEVFTSAHALAEAYATLSGDPRLKIQPMDAAQMVEDLAKTLAVRTLSVADYRQLISSAPAKGIRGGGIYDALHAQTARGCGCKEIRTLNIAHFKHVAPDLSVRDL
jgi:predicted nucleic acid-binding protein